MAASDANATIPVWLPPICAAASCLIGGLTGFGDAIMFHILFNIAGALGLVETGSREVLAKAVTYTTVLSLSNLPAALFVARDHLRLVLPFAATVAITGIPMVTVGASLLFHADLHALKVFVGLFFLTFAVGKLTSACVGIARSSTADQAPRVEASVTSSSSASDKVEPTAALSGDSPPVAVESFVSSPDCVSVTSSVVQIAAESPSASEPHAQSSGPASQAGGSGIDAGSGVDNDLIVTAPLSQAAFHDRLLSRIRPISPVHSIKATLLFCLAAGSLSGLLNGLLGTGGPPQMIAYALLHLHKDTIRAMSACYGGFELPMRVYMFTSADGNVFDVNDWPEYLSVAVAGWIGFGLGTSLRRFADTDAIIRILLVLVFASSAILLGALENPALAVAYVIGGLAWGAMLLVLLLRPSWCTGYIRAWDAAWSTCKLRVTAGRGVHMT